MDHSGGVDHAPYADGRAPFTIGLTPIPLSDLLEIDDAHATQTALKRRLHAQSPRLVFAEEPASRPAQAEAAALIEQALEAAGRAMPKGPDLPPLLRAAFAVQEDLLLMARDAANLPFRLVAGSLSFPSSWSLAEKFGRAMAEIHDPVPGFGQDTRNAAVIDRVFAAIKPLQPAERFAWSIYGDAELAHPPEADAARSRGERTAAILADPHLRIERQTLTKLPQSGAILFMVRIHLQPLAAIEAEPDRAAALADSLEAMSDEAIAFKYLALARPALVARLRGR